MAGDAAELLEQAPSLLHQRLAHSVGERRRFGLIAIRRDRMKGYSATQNLALLVGVVFLAVGVLGFILAGRQP